MERFLVDEDLPRSLAVNLRQAGYVADDVRDVGLRGHDDSAVLAYAQAHDAAPITRDKGFTNTLHYPLGSHAGIVVARFPSGLPVAQVNAALLGALARLQGRSLRGLLIIVALGRTRIRRPTGPGTLPTP